MRTLCAALLTWIVLCTQATSHAAQWQMWVNEQGKLVVLCDGASVVTSTYVFWDAGWKFAGTEITLGQPQSDGKVIPFTGRVAKLNLFYKGTITQTAANTLVFQYELEAAREHASLIGGGLEFNLKLNEPVLDAAAGEPVLLEDNRGWKWNVGGGETLSVRFDPPLPRVYFEQGRKHKIRSFFASQTLAAGKHTYSVTVTLPSDGQVVQNPEQRAGRTDKRNWHIGALHPTESPVDLRFLNDKPAGGHGFLRTVGDELVFEDGTAVRFWGCNIAANTLFADDRDIQVHARRIAQLGYNLVRIHHHDSMSWVSPTVIDKARADSQHLDPLGMEKLDWWIKCLRDEGVYVWLDLHVGRNFKLADNIDGFDEIKRSAARGQGFCYVNPRLAELLADFNEKYLSHVNPHTKLAYKDDPAVAFMLITNENDLTHHFGNLMLADKNNPFHQQLFEEKLHAFCRRTGLKPWQVGKTWVPGPSKLLLNDLEYRFNTTMLDHLRGLGVRVPIATTSSWGRMPIFSLPALGSGDVIDAHAYSQNGLLDHNPRVSGSFVTHLAASQMYGKPLTVSEWNTPAPAKHRYAVQMYLMSIASLQGWDALMLYNYAQDRSTELQRPHRPTQWSTFHDPTITGLAPAAAIAFRQQHVRRAEKTYCLLPGARQFFGQAIGAASSATIRTLMEQHRITIGMPRTPQLPWLEPTTPDRSTIVVTDPNRDFLGSGATEVRSDTGELVRDWVRGIHTIDTAQTQAASGWLGGETIDLNHVQLKLTNPQAILVVTSLDGEPIDASRRLLITAVARVLPDNRGRAPYRSEPIAGQITIRSTLPDMQWIALNGDGSHQPPAAAPYEDGQYSYTFRPDYGTHWFLLTDEDQASR